MRLEAGFERQRKKTPSPRPCVSKTLVFGTGSFSPSQCRLASHRRDAYYLLATELSAPMNTPPTEFESASVPQRFVAQGIDVVLCFALAVLPAQFLTSSSGFIAIALVFVLIVCALAYRFFADGVFGGAALGKRILSR